MTFILGIYHGASRQSATNSAPFTLEGLNKATGIIIGDWAIVHISRKLLVGTTVIVLSEHSRATKKNSLYKGVAVVTFKSAGLFQFGKSSEIVGKQ